MTTQNELFNHESRAARKAKHLSNDAVNAIRQLHNEWKPDEEIGEQLGLTALTVWHARTMRGINRHIFR